MMVVKLCLNDYFAMWSCSLFLDSEGIKCHIFISYLNVCKNFTPVSGKYIVKVLKSVFTPRKYGLFSHGWATYQSTTTQSKTDATVWWAFF